MDAETIAKDTARYIFNLGAELNSPCYRIEFKGGEWPETEISQGGLNEDALAKVIQLCLEECAE